MSSEINLLYSKKERRKYKLSSQVRYLRFGALGFLFLVTLVSMTFFLLVVASPLTSLKQQELQQNQLLTQSEEKIRKQTLLALRMNDISTIVAKRSQFDQILNELIQKLPNGVIIKEFTAEKKQISLSVQSSNSKDIETYMGSLGTMVATKKYFSRVFLDSMNVEVGNDRQASDFRARFVITLF
jgi:Tfp pilus assembly protein PilN